VELPKRAKFPFKQRRKPEVTHNTVLWCSGSARSHLQDQAVTCSFIHLHFWAHSQNFETWLLAASFPSVCVRPSAWDYSAPIGRIFMKSDIWIFFENLLRKFKLN
jgi:hypothetical protein